MHIPYDSFDIDTPSFWLRIGTAILCGGAIGLERQFRGKAAGVRTCILVCLGTEIFIGLGAAFPSEHVDPSRVLGQVITGIGFLGAGVILARDGRVLGVTSAAVIWLLAGIGAVVGLGHVATAIVLTMITLLILIGVEALETMWTRARQRNKNNSLDHLELD